MVVAAVLFLGGLIIGKHRGLLELIIVSAIATAALLVLWLARDELSRFSLAVWFGYMLALQSGFLVGGYMRTQEDD